MANIVRRFASCSSNRCLLSKSIQNYMSVRTASHTYESKAKRWKVNTSRLMYWRSRSYDAMPHPLRHRNEFLEWNYKSELFAFNKRLSEKFSEENLRVAFTDASYVQQEQKKREELDLVDVPMHVVDNTQLSLLGEKKLREFIQLYLRHYVPRMPEEGIRSVAEYLYSDTVLSDIGKRIGCTELIMCDTIPPTDEMFAKTTKALIGALLTDTDDKHTEKFIIDFVLTYLHEKDLMEIWEIPHPEIALTNILRNDNFPDPEPRLLRETGRNTIHCCFMVGLYVNKQLIGCAAGESVNIAREMAAYDALRRMFHLTPAKTLFKYGKYVGDVDFAQHSEEHPSIRQWKQSAFEKKQKLIAYS